MPVRARSQRSTAPVRRAPRAAAAGAATGAAAIASAAGHAAAAIVPRRIAGGRHPEWRLGELTVRIGPARAELRYAREPVGFCRPTPDAILDAVHRARGRLAARSRDPDELLPALAAAYSAVLRKQRARPGARVALVELRAQITGYTRAQFAWDLARLRRERRLAFAGRRLDLGVATGHAAAHRARVVWIEDDGGGGSYFASFRLIAQESA